MILRNFQCWESIFFLFLFIVTNVLFSNELLSFSCKTCKTVFLSHTKKIQPSILSWEKAMSYDANYQEFFKKTDPRDTVRLPPEVSPRMYLDFLKRLYEKNSQRIFQSNKMHAKEIKQKHEKIIHQIWFGKQMPLKYKKWQAAWKAKHPDWTFICWTEEFLKQAFPQGLYNQKSFYDAKRVTNYARMSDVVRYELLYRYGGLYLDCDAECLFPFDELHQVYAFYAGLEEIRFHVELGNAVIGCRSGHPIMKRCMEIIKEYEVKKPFMQGWDTSSARNREMNETLLMTGPVVLTRAIWEAADQDGNCDIVFPSVYFYGSAINAPVFFCKHYFFDTWIGQISV